MRAVLIMILKMLMETVCSIEGANINYVTFSQTVDNSHGYATSSSTTTTALTTLPTSLNGIFDALKILAISLTTIYFLYEVNSKWTFEGHDLSVKSIGAPFLKWGAATIIINHSADIISFALAMNDKIVRTSAESAEAFDPYGSVGEATVMQVFEDICDSVGIMEMLVLVIIAIIAWCIAMACKLVWNFKGLSYKLEFMFRLGCTPLAVADCYNGFNSSAMRWIKGFVGLAIYGYALVNLPIIGGEIAMSNWNDAMAKIATVNSGLGSGSDSVGAWKLLLDQMFILLVIPIAELGAAGAIKQVCKEAAS